MRLDRLLLEQVWNLLIISLLIVIIIAVCQGLYERTIRKLPQAFA